MNHLIDEYGRRGAALPTAVVAANDNQAVGIMRALHEHGLRIPQDISVVGFDDMSGVDNMYPPLTTVHPDFEGLGVAAMRETLRLLGEGGEPTFLTTQHGMGAGFPPRCVPGGPWGRLLGGKLALLSNRYDA